MEGKKWVGKKTNFILCSSCGTTHFFSFLLDKYLPSNFVFFRTSCESATIVSFNSENVLLLVKLQYLKFKDSLSYTIVDFWLTEIGAVVLNFLPRSKILNRPTVSTHYRIQKYVKKICLHKLIVEIALFVYIFVKFRNRIIRVKKI